LLEKNLHFVEERRVLKGALGVKLIHSHGKGLLPICGAIFLGNHQDRKFAKIRADELGEFGPTHPGHVHVGDQQIKGLWC
jgi:hypothetical protein